MEKSVILLTNLLTDYFPSVTSNCGTHNDPTNLSTSWTILLNNRFKNTNNYILINLNCYALIKNILIFLLSVGRIYISYDG